VPLLLPRLMRSVARLPVGALPAALLIVVLLTSWPLMLLAEPAGASIVQPANYWWWFTERIVDELLADGERRIVLCTGD
jgi:voltage-gated potassium channel